jgi:3-hydroxyisobutyrate dehydrogenase-like beta-hydroxyacid dehydrogenase
VAGLGINRSCCGSRRCYPINEGNELAVRGEDLTVGFVGWGEVGYFLSLGLSRTPLVKSLAYNYGHTNRPPYSPAYQARAVEAKVELVVQLEELLSRSKIVVSATPASQAAVVGQRVLRGLRAGQLFVDISSCRPQTKILLSEAAAARGVDFAGAVLLEWPGRNFHASKIIASGPGADKLTSLMSPFGMNIKVIPGEAGAAARLKTIRNIVAKGYQALLWEAALAMLASGIDPLAEGQAGSLDEIVAHLPSPRHLLRHAARHAERKSEELEDAAAFLGDLHVEPIITMSASQRLRALANSISDEAMIDAWSDADKLSAAMERLAKAIFRSPITLSTSG